MKVFESTGQISLAYITAKTHGLDTDAEKYHDLLVGANVPVPSLDPSTTGMYMCIISVDYFIYILCYTFTTGMCMCMCRFFLIY